MTVLALDAGVRETGWAVFLPGGTVETGIIRLFRSRTLDTASRVNLLVERLDSLVTCWSPRVIAYGQPSGIRWPAPSLEFLDASLVKWASARQLVLYTYPAQEVRTAIARHSRVPPDQLAYAIMQRLRLIGVRKSTPEWEALAIGYYHLRGAAITGHPQVGNGGL